MKKALIFGVSGQDGSYLAKLLLSKGYKVYGASRDAQVSSFSNLKKLNVFDQVETLSVALSDFRSVLTGIKKVMPNEIYNLSGQSSVGLSFEQPVETMESIAIGTLNLLEAVRFLSTDIKIYNAGSSECFGDTNGIPANELTPFRPRSPYGVAKSSAHWQIANYREAYNLFACTGILFNHESNLRPDRFVTRKIITSAIRIANGSQEKLRLGNTSVVRDWGWAPEYVEAMWLMLQKDKASDYVIATGKSHSLNHFIELVFEELSLDYKKFIEIDQSLFRPSDLMESYADPEKALSELNWKAEMGLKDLVKELIKDQK